MIPYNTGFNTYTVHPVNNTFDTVQYYNTPEYYNTAVHCIIKCNTYSIERSPVHGIVITFPSPSDIGISNSDLIIGGEPAHSVNWQ